MPRISAMATSPSPFTQRRVWVPPIPVNSSGSPTVSPSAGTTLGGRTPSSYGAGGQGGGGAVVAVVGGTVVAVVVGVETSTTDVVVSAVSAEQAAMSNTTTMSRERRTRRCYRGPDKTYLVCAIGISACHSAHTVTYTRMDTLARNLSVARGDGTARQKLLGELSEVDLLIIDLCRHRHRSTTSSPSASTPTPPPACSRSSPTATTNYPP